MAPSTGDPDESGPSRRLGRAGARGALADAAPAGGRRRPSPTHPCARCGAPVGPGVGLCERCNPLGLRDSAASQVHGTVFGVVAIAIVLLLVVARLSIAGIGPFPASVVGVTPTADGLAVTITVTNEGTDAGQTTCRIVDVADRGVSRQRVRAQPADRGRRDRQLRRRWSPSSGRPRELAVTCRTP